MLDTLELEMPAVTQSVTTFSRPTLPETSALAWSRIELEPELPSEPDPTWARWYISFLQRNVERLGRDVRQLHQELPRLLEFRRAFRELLRCSWNQRATRETLLAQQVRLSSVPTHYIGEVLRQCSMGGGPDGLDIGVDFLCQLGQQTLEEAQKFLKKDQGRWKSARPALHHANDDIWYILLRALARSEVPSSSQIPLLTVCALRGTRNVREAATHGLGDLGGDDARLLLQGMAAKDSDSLVRESAREALEDLEG